MVKSARELNSYSLHHKGGFVPRLLEEGLNYLTSGEHSCKKRKNKHRPIFYQKISTKNARFTTFPNLRQNCVNAFEIKYFYTQCLFLTLFLFNHPHHTF